MIKKPVTLQSDLDMESRPIAHLVQEASQYDSTVYIEMDNMKINALRADLLLPFLRTVIIGNNCGDIRQVAKKRRTDLVKLT